METLRLRLHADFTDISVIQWYTAAAVGDLAVVEVPSRGCRVELLRHTAEQVLWSVRGGRSMTMPLSDALNRLQLLSTDYGMAPQREAGAEPWRMAADVVV